MYRSANTLRRSVGLCMETLEDRRLLAIDLVADIAPGSASSHPKDFTVAGENLYFTADDGVHGRELWRVNSDDQANLVKDVFPGERSARIDDLVPLGNEVLFTVSIPTNHDFLWKTIDGGTDAVPFHEVPGSVVLGLKHHGRMLYTVNRDDSPNVEFWVSDGTADGTHAIDGPKDISVVGQLNGETYFVRANSLDIWKWNESLTEVEPVLTASWLSDGFEGTAAVLTKLQPIEGELGFQMCARSESLPRTLCRWYFFDETQKLLPNAITPAEVKLDTVFNGSIYKAGRVTTENGAAGNEVVKRDQIRPQPRTEVEFVAEAFSISESGKSIGPAIAVVRSDGTERGYVRLQTSVEQEDLDGFVGFSGSGHDFQIFRVEFDAGETEKVVPFSAMTIQTYWNLEEDHAHSAKASTNDDGAFTLLDDRLFRGDRRINLRLWDEGHGMKPRGKISAQIDIVEDDPVGTLVTETEDATLLFVGGESDTLDVQLSFAPTAKVVVEVAHDQSLVMANPTHFEFSPENWNHPQSLVVRGGSRSGRTSLRFTASSDTAELLPEPVVSEFALTISDPPRFEVVSPNLEMAMVDWELGHRGAVRVNGLSAVGDTLFFGADNGEFDTNLQLWKVSESGEIFLVHALPEEFRTYNSEISRSIAADGKLIFTLEWWPQCYRVCTTFYDWWESDGTREGTRELVPSYAQYNYEDAIFSNARVPLYRAFGPDGALYYENGRGSSLRFDGNSIEVISGSQSPFHVHNGSLYYVSEETLWRTDDGMETTHRVGGSGLVRDGVAIHSIDDSVYFTGDAVFNEQADSYEATSLYRVKSGSDSSEKIFESQSVIWRVLAGSDRLFFHADGALWIVDNNMAEPARLMEMPFFGRHSVVSEGVLYFSASESWGIGKELWRSDGTSEGTYQLKNINTAGAASDPRDFTVVGDKVFFTATDRHHGLELWVTDGTEAGTELYVDLTEGRDSSSYSNFIAQGEYLYFVGSNETGGGLWRTNVERAFADPLPGDADGDQSVTFADFLVLSSNFGQTTDAGFAAGDFDESGNVDMDDFLLLAANFGK